MASVITTLRPVVGAGGFVKQFEVKTERKKKSGGAAPTLQERIESQEEEAIQQNQARRSVVSRQSVVFKAAEIQSLKPSSIAPTLNQAVGITSFSPAKLAQEFRKLSKQTGASPAQLSAQLEALKAAQTQEQLGEALQSKQGQLQSEQQRLLAEKKVLESKAFLTETDVKNFESQVRNFEFEAKKFETDVAKNQVEFARLTRVGQAGLLGGQAGAVAKARVEQQRLEKQGQELGIVSTELNRRGQVIEGQEKAAFAIQVQKAVAEEKQSKASFFAEPNKGEEFFFAGPKDPVEFGKQTIVETPARVQELLGTKIRPDFKGNIAAEAGFGASKIVLGGLEATVGTVGTLAGGTFERTFPKGVKVGVKFGKPKKILEEGKALLELPIVKELVAPAVRGVVSKEGVFVSRKSAPTIAFLAPLALEPIAKVSLGAAKGLAKVNLKALPKIKSPIAKILAEERASLAGQAAVGKGSQALFAPIVRARQGLVPIAFKKIDAKIAKASKPFAKGLVKIQVGKIRAGLVLQEKIGVPIELAKATVGKKAEQLFLASRKPLEKTELGLIRTKRAVTGTVKGGFKTFKQIAIEPLKPVPKDIARPFARARQEIQLGKVFGKAGLKEIGTRTKEFLDVEGFTKPLKPVPKDIARPFARARQEIQKTGIATKTIIDLKTKNLLAGPKLFVKQVIVSPLKPLGKDFIAPLARARQGIQVSSILGKSLVKKISVGTKQFLDVEGFTKPLKPLKKSVKEKLDFAKLNLQTVKKSAGLFAKKEGIAIARPIARQVAKAQIFARRAGLVTKFELGLIKGRQGLDLEKGLIKTNPVKQVKGKTQVKVKDFKEPQISGSETELQTGGTGFSRKRFGRSRQIFLEEEFAPAKSFGKPSFPAIVFTPLVGRQTFFEKNKGRVSTKKIEEFKQKTANLSDFKIKTKSDLKFNVGIKTGIGFKDSFRGGTRFVEGTALSLRNAFASRSRFGEATKLKTKQIELTKPKPPKPFLFPLPADKDVFFQDTKRVEGYNAFVKDEPFSKTRFIRVTKMPLPFEAAKERGFKVADETISQTVKIKKAGAKVSGQSSPLISLGSKFSKRGNQFIEKRGFAIDSFGEKEKLRVSAFLAKERKGFFGGSKVSIKSKRGRKK